MPFWIIFILMIGSYFLGILTGVSKTETDYDSICAECIAKGED